MGFAEKYTTNEKITAEANNLETEEKVEITKTIISNDAYAVGEVVECLMFKIERLGARLK